MTDQLFSSPSLDSRHLLIDWANKQDGWMRTLVLEILEARQPVSPEQVAELLELFLSEKGLNDSPFSPVEPLQFTAEPQDPDERLQLVKLSQVAGVNALTSGYEIDFSPGLTILYGENGVGKTGYARILKRLAAVRHAEPILSDITKSGQTPRSARIDYRLGDVDHAYDWHDESGVSPFTRLAVFDTPAVNLHVDDNLGYVYTPADLSLFGYVTSGIRAVQELGADRRREWAPGSNPFVRFFARGSTIYQAVESLSAASDLDSLAEMAVLPANAAGERDRLDREVGALRTNTLESVLASHRDALGVLQQLAATVDACRQFDPRAYNEAVTRVATLTESYRAVREETFAPAELPGLPDDGWQNFVGSAKAYQDHLGLQDYPHDGAQCLYCRQPLSPDAVALIRRYRSFLDDAIARQLGEAQRLLADAARPLASFRVEGFEDGLRRRRDAGEDDAVVGAAFRLVETLRAASAAVQQSAPIVATLDLTDHADRAEAAAVEPLGAHRAAVERLAQQMSDRRESLATAEAALADLTARMELDRRLPEIRIYVERAKRATTLEKVLERLPNTLRSLTEVSKLASEELVNQDFEQRFREECAHLRTPKVQLEFVGREGKAQRRKTIAPSVRLSQVLAEGEQKVLALADFLAEARLGGSSAPVIFDDPVNSLDHRRLEEVARRIASLVDDRQVIVFTHNIWLATELLALFEKRKDECAYFAVTDDRTTGAKGRVDRAGGPRWDTEKDLGKRVQSLLDDAAQASGETQTALVESAYGLMRSWCEVAVEQVLFGGVSQRYRANVMMGRLSEVHPDRLPGAIQAISDIFDRACRFIPDHSQPLHRLGTRPSLADAQTDWSKCKDTLKQYRAPASS